MDDVNLTKPLALESLATQFQPVEDKRGKQNAVERSSKTKKKEKSFNNEMDFEPFDFDVTSNY